MIKGNLERGCFFCVYAILKIRHRPLRSVDINIVRYTIKFNQLVIYIITKSLNYSVYHITITTLSLSREHL